jgi:hypothetical protein
MRRTQSESANKSIWYTRLTKYREQGHRYDSPTVEQINQLRSAIGRHVLTLHSRIPSWSTERVCGSHAYDIHKTHYLTESLLVSAPNFSNPLQVQVAVEVLVSMSPNLVMPV